MEGLLCSWQLQQGNYAASSHPPEYQTGNAASFGQIKGTLFDEQK